MGNTIALMDLLKSWLSAERGRAARLALHLKVPPSFVTKMGDGKKAGPVQHGAGIEQFTGGAVTRQHMFPNDWHRIWPELSDSPANDPQPPATEAAGQGVANA